MTLFVKICGLQDEASVQAAVDGGATMVGFVFYPASQNSISRERAAELCRLVPIDVLKVGLFVDATNADIAAVLEKVPLNVLQLHGKETPERVADIRRTTNVPVMKALRLKSPEQFDVIPSYETVADLLLFDSRIGNEPSGGPLDWEMLRGRSFARPWMLAGGLTVDNLADAVRLSGAVAVDVSSGVEDVPYHKSPAKISEFLKVAETL